MRFIPLLCLLVLFPLLADAESSSEINRFLSSRIVAGQVFFGHKDTRLNADSKQRIDDLIVSLRNYQRKGRLLRIEGFSSTEGSDQRNMKLSLSRALAVKDYLHDKHQLKVDVFLTGFGEKKSVDGKIALERRVDIAVYQRNPAADALFDETGTIERYNLQ